MVLGRVPRRIEAELGRWPGPERGRLGELAAALRQRRVVRYVPRHDHEPWNLRERGRRALVARRSLSRSFPFLSLPFPLGGVVLAWLSRGRRVRLGCGLEQGRRRQLARDLLVIDGLVPVEVPHDAARLAECFIPADEARGRERVEHRAEVAVPVGQHARLERPGPPLEPAFAIGKTPEPGEGLQHGQPRREPQVPELLVAEQLGLDAADAASHPSPSTCAGGFFSAMAIA